MLGESDELGFMSEEAINRALEIARARIARVERERAELARDIAATREEEHLLTRLLALRRGAATGEAPEREPDHGFVGVSASETKYPAVVAVLDELKGAGRPLHISELMRLLRERKIEIPGSGTQANLITHLRRDERLMRPSRGMYALATWGLADMAPARRVGRRRKRIRIRSTASDGRTQG
jgi:hypothetical protein